jgi:chemotaxis signal transduction protein
LNVIEKKQLEATAHATSSQQAPSAAVESADGPAETSLQQTSFERQYCVFRAGRERFCLSVLQMEEVVEWPAVTQVPLSPAFLMGVFNLRGAIVPVIDIAFAEGRRPDLKPRHVVVAALQQEPGHDVMRLGIAADEVIGTFAATEPLQVVNDAPRELSHCCGMLRHETDRLALALDLKRLAEAFSVGVI